MRSIAKMCVYSAIGLTFLSCTEGESKNSKDYYVNPYATVNGEIIPIQSSTTQGLIIDNRDLSYITAFTYEGGNLYYSVSTITSDGKFNLSLKKNIIYNFVIFDSSLKPAVYVSMNSNNVIYIKDDSFIKIFLQLFQDGTIKVSDLELDDNSEMYYDYLFEDINENLLPDIAEEDNDNDGMPDYDEDGDGIFDGIEEDDDDDDNEDDNNDDDYDNDD